MSVWLVETEESTNGGIYLVADSLNAAVQAIKDKYPTPYVVAWSEPYQDSCYSWVMKGYFEEIPGHSEGHTAQYNFTEWNFHEDQPGGRGFRFEYPIDVGQSSSGG